MTPSEVHQLLNIERLFGSFCDASRVAQQHIGREHGAVKPVNLTAATNAAHNADIRARNFRSHLGHKVFWKTIGIGRAGRLFLHSHCRNFPHHHFPHEALGKNGIVGFPTQLNSTSSEIIRHCAASCSILELQKNNAALRAQKFRCAA